MKISLKWVDISLLYNGIYGLEAKFKFFSENSKFKNFNDNLKRLSQPNLEINLKNLTRKIPKQKRFIC